MLLASDVAASETFKHKLQKLWFMHVKEEKKHHRCSEGVDGEEKKCGAVCEGGAD